MPSQTTSFLHSLPQDIADVLRSNPDIQQLWDSLTPLARNEWICWVTLVKKEETRKSHLIRLVEDLRAGEKRPCCWPGCPHRNPKNQKWFRSI